MNSFLKITAALTVILILSQGSRAADIQNARLTISGNVPAIFSMEVRSQAGELDLGLSSSVGSRLLAVIHFRVNIDIADFLLTPSTNGGRPRLNGLQNGSSGVDTWTVIAHGSDGTAATTCPVLRSNTPYTFAADASALHIGPNSNADSVSGAGGNTAFTEGYDSGCTLVGSWSRTGASAGRIPMAGLYSTTYMLTMISI